MTLPRTRFLAVALFFAPFALRADIVISEIMYHPQSEDVLEEYIELYNSGASPVDLSGWRLSSGVEFTVPTGTSISPGAYLVLTASPEVFHAKYPSVSNYIAAAGWTGRLSNSSNHIRLDDPSGTKRDEVTYADDGDWAVRERDDVDFGHRGWRWASPADGHGSSLELVNLLFDNDIGQNWKASLVAEGTPGAGNSVADADLAPVILEASHFPLVPTSTDSVAITCQIKDDNEANVTVILHWREDRMAWNTASMADDGAHGDAAAGDEVFGAVLPPRANGTIVEFYIEAVDTTDHSRTWPAPAVVDGVLEQSQNALFQVDDTVYAGAQPLYRVVLRDADRAELAQINANTPAAPFPTPDQTFSHAKFNGTWITHDGTGDKLVYLAGVRNRGNGSRNLSPQSYNVSFRNDAPWKDILSINLNTQDTPYQVLGSALFRKAGLTMAESRAVQVRINGANLAGSGAPSYGFYAANETQNAEFADHHFPLDSSGNIYRALRQDTLGGANLRDESAGQPADTADPTPYRVNYFKETNESEDRWADLIQLTKVIAKGISAANFTATYTSDYVDAIQSVGDTAQWEKFMAVNILADNSETNISNGDGDDYYLYFGANDPRGVFIPYDLDTILGRSSGSNSATHSIFRMCRADIAGNAPMPLHPFMLHPKFAREYLAELKRQLDGPFSAAEFAELADQTLGSLVSPTVVSAMKTFNANRTAYVQGILPLSLSGISASTTGGTALAITNGYPRSTAATCNLQGKADCTRTASVKVNGVPATYTPWKVTNVASFATSVGDWQAANVALSPGLNRILVQAFDEADAEIEHTYFTVWYDDGSVANVSGAIASNTTWTAAGGPYQVTAALTVNAGVTLTIQPGTTVYLASGVGITVAAGGRILAEGTEAQPIRFSRAPAGTGNGGTIRINGQAGAPESHLYYCYFELGGDPAVLATTNSNVVIDHCEWGRTDASYLHLDGGSFVVSHCIFPSATGEFELVHGNGVPPAGGRAIIRDCFFGKALLYNDVVDFTGGNRPGTIIQFLNNVFIGTDDDELDLDGTDAWVEGNIFMHVHRNGAPDSSSAVSGGNDSGNTSEVTIVGNLFYDVDQAATAKQGNFYTFLQNTVVDQNGRGSQDPFNAVLNFADEGIAEAGGMYVEGNIIHSAEALVRNYPGTALAGTVTLNNNLLPPGFTWTGAGSGNIAANPLLNDVQLVDPNAPSGGAFRVPTPGPDDYERVAAEIRAQFGLRPGSPAIGTGPNGNDKGGVRLMGVTLGGAPVGTTNATTAAVNVGTLMKGNSIPNGTGTFPNGSGWTHYQWRLNAGPWSAETPLDTPISLTGLANGPQTLEVVGRNDAGFYQDNASFGTDARVSRISWTVDTAYVPPTPAPLVQISEVLAKNVETQGFSGVFPDIIELHNAGNASADLGGWGLTDNAAVPYKYTIPNGTTLAAGARLVIYASGSGSVPAPKTGFALKDDGDTLTLTRSAAGGGGVADSVTFGAQLPDFSIGRRESDGVWDMCMPTFGASNVVAAQGAVAGVKINEWLADAVALFPNDFIELHNPGTLPVNLGGCYLSDNPVEWPAHHQIRQLTFLGASGYLYLKADNDPEQGADHLNFKLASEQGEIGLFDPALKLIDNVIYGPQTSDISEGRTPNGGATLAFFNQPTPGAPNPGSIGGTTNTVNLMPATQVWKYYVSPTAAPPNDAQGRSYTDPQFDDSSWSAGGGVLYIENSAIPTNADGFAKTTLLTGYNATHPYQTYYFRTHFTFGGPLTGTTLSAKWILDDGAVMYLNGQELPRVRIDSGPVDYATQANGTAPEVTIETIPNLPVSALIVGDNVLVCEVHQSGTQSATGGSSDITWGMKLDARVVVGTGSVVLNEVLPVNGTLTNPGGGFAGWIELLNTSTSPVDISDMSLTNDLTAPRKYVVASGTSIPAGGYLVFYCDDTAPASATNLGFALNGDGGGIYLFRKSTDGGGLQDSVSYGFQIPDFSLGRVPDGSGAFALNVPSRGAMNMAAALGTVSSVKVNEWLANAMPTWFELFNTAAEPVALGGSYLTDQLGNRTKHLVPPLSFIAGAGSGRWRQLIADNDAAATPAHVNFSLNAGGESIGLFSGAGVQLDAVSFGPQVLGVSQGRYTDGTSAIVSMPPTPGAANKDSNADTDLDGIPDIWEIPNGLNANDHDDAALDLDGDGQSNLAEYLAGTNPRSGASRLAASLVPTATAGQYAVRFNAIAGKSYTVRYKDDLNAPTWTKLADVPPPAFDTSLEVPDATAGSHTRRFYQVVTPQQP